MDMILRVEESIRSASDQLGSSHALVESARRELRQLRADERKTRQEEIVQYHAAIVGSAMEAGDIEALEAACQTAVTPLLLLPPSSLVHQPMSV